MQLLLEIENVLPNGIFSTVPLKAWELVGKMPACYWKIVESVYDYFANPFSKEIQIRYADNHCTSGLHVIVSCLG